jgi:hypothetical protein
LGIILTYYNFYIGNQISENIVEYSQRNTTEDIFNEKVYSEDK